MFVIAVLVGLIGMIGQWDGKLFGEARFDQPIVMGALVGLACGDLRTGVILGAQFQLIWMGIIGVGATPSMDVASGVTLGTAFAILSGTGIETALILSLPIAVLLQYVNVWFRSTVIPPLMHIGDKYASEGNARMIGVLHWTGIMAFGILLGFVPCFLGVLWGTGPVEALIRSVPQTMMNGFCGIAKIFPTFGFALLLNVTLDAHLIPFLIIAFVLSAYLGLNTIAIALIATAFAMFMFQSKRASDTAQASEEDDL